MKNPPSTQPYGPYLISVFNNSIRSLQCAGVYNTVSTPNTMAVGISNMNKIISSTVTTVRMTIIIATPVPASVSLMIAYTTGPTISYTGTNTPAIANSTTFVFNNVVVTATNSTFIIGNFTVKNPPSTQSYTMTFTTFVNSSGTQYKIDTFTSTIFCNPGVMSATLTPGNLSINSINTYTFSLTLTNPLISGSFINVVVPSILVLSGSCASNVSGASCSRSGSNVTVTTTSTLSASIVQITFTVQNPNSVQTTGVFTAFTYYSGYTSLVDNMTAGPTVTFTANEVTTASITPQSTTIASSTSYQFSITNKDPIPIGGYFTLTFPSTVTCGSSSLTVNVLSSSLDGTCSALCSSNVVTFSSCMQLTAKTNTTPIALSISPVTNPSSFAPSNYFTFFSYDINGRMINYLNSSVASFRVTMDTMAPLTATITPTSFVVNQPNMYTFVVVFTATHVTGDYLTIVFPSSMSPPSTPSCTSVSGLTAAACSIVSGNIKVIMTFGGGFPSNKTVSFNISSVTNGQLAQSNDFSIQSSDTNNFAMETGTSSVTYTPATITTVSVNNNNNIVVLNKSNVTLTVSTPFTLQSSYLASNTQLIITIPPDFTIGSTCSSTLGTCSPANSTAYTITGIGLTVSSVVITLTNITLPYFSSTSSSFSLSYQYGSTLVAQANSGITVSVYCTPPCMQCSTSKTACLSCLPNPPTTNTFIYYDASTLTCLDSCPSTGYFINTNNDCLACNVSCKTCVSSTNCSSCKATFALSNFVCVSSCPTKQYNNSGFCTDCPAPCDTCQNATYCLTCLTGNFFNGTCPASCPTGYYSASQICTLCPINCSACNSNTNCTNCSANYFFLNYQCLSTCPNGYFSNATNCT